ncbi:MAG: PQQ-binding-like beta-propeller repeat protein, partial [Planctomycetia bacterium]|nr:PQQ-binding-like beta-propeller repeat protein [Planctomycetia bacterium]
MNSWRTSFGPLGWVAAVVALLSIGSVALAGDWPQFKRDAARTGDAPDEVLEFPMHRVVAVKFPAPIYASAAVVAGRVYVQDVRGQVACIDGASGKVVWLTSIGGVANHSSPAVANGRVFVGSSAGHLAILDAKDGKLLAKVPGKGGVVASPALANGHVYFSALDGELIKIDYSGRVVWTFAEATGSFLDFAVRGDDILFFGRSEKVAPPYRENSVRLFHLRDEGKSVKLLTSRWAQTYPTSGLVFAEKDRCGYQTWRAEEGSSIVEVWDEDLKTTVHSWSPGGDNPDGRAIPAYRDGRFFF